MPRNEKGILPDVWASAATPAVDVTPIEDFTLGYDSAYTSDKYPDRRHLNDVLQRVTATSADVNKYGAALPWHTGITYQPMAMVTHQSEVYVALQASTGKDPRDDPSAAAFWQKLEDFLGIVAPQVRTMAVKINSHTGRSLTGSTIGTHTFTISGFVLASGYPASKIRKLYIQFYGYGWESDWTSSVTFPWGDNVVVHAGRIFVNGSGSEQIWHTNIVEIPVNVSQENIVITLARHPTKAASSFTILGAQIDEV
jgi:hypothetical protein